MEEIRASVISINFEGDNGFKIVRAREKGGGIISVVGKLEGVGEGDPLILRGEYNEHPVYGKEFLVKDFEFDQEAKEESIVRFISSNRIKGIGEKKARKIVEKFGEDTINILKNSPDKLLEINGIGKNNIKMIKESIAELGDTFDSLIFLNFLGFGSALSYKILESMEGDIESEIRENPYILIKKVKGIGFKLADRAAKRLGIPDDSPFRLKSYILYLLESSLEEGHTFLHREELENLFISEMSSSSEVFTEMIESLLEEEEIVVIDTAVYLKYVYEIEQKIVDKLLILKKHPFVFTLKPSEKTINEIENKWGIKVDETQRDVILNVINNKLSIITGGPGTGKTTILKFIISLLKQNGKTVFIAAPTGRAAKRISETSGEEAKTIHRLLEYIPGKEGFMKNRFNPLEAEAVIIDEASMMDIFIFYRLLDALGPNTQLILVGDHYQLPPVGPGYVFRDLVNSGKIPVYFLEKIYRRDEDSLISLNALKVKRGEMPEIGGKENKISDFYFIRRNKEDDILKLILELYLERIPSKFMVDPFSDSIQILTPIYRGVIGVDNLNKIVQSELNSSRKGIKHYEKVFKKGDKVMQLKNNYEKDVFNGDIGRVKRINHYTQTIEIDYYDKTVVYERKEFNEITLAYAISIHKSQGSEYDYVIVPITKSQGIMLQRNLIYTAITRAKKMMIFVGDPEALEIAVKNNTPLKRNSRIYELVVERL